MEPNGQNELSYVGEREESGSLGQSLLFLLVTNAPFKDLFFLFQKSITPINIVTAYEWKAGLSP